MTSLGNKEVFARNLNYYIEKSGRTQKELSEITGVATSTFNDWVKAKKYPRIDKIEILASYFGILKSDLIEDKVSEEAQKKNDVLADIIVKLRTNNDLMLTVERLCKLNKNELDAINQMLTAFKK